MQDERVFFTNIDDLSASGFGCRIKGLGRLHNKQPITALFVLPDGKASYHQIRSFSGFSLKRG
jgi:hypothetical protein